MVLTTTNRVGEFVQVSDEVIDGKTYVKKTTDGMRKTMYPVKGTRAAFHLMYKLIK